MTHSHKFQKHTLKYSNTSADEHQIHSRANRAPPLPADTTWTSSADRAIGPPCSRPSTRRSTTSTVAASFRSTTQTPPPHRPLRRDHPAPLNTPDVPPRVRHPWGCLSRWGTRTGTGAVMCPVSFNTSVSHQGIGFSWGWATPQRDRRTRYPIMHISIFVTESLSFHIVELFLAAVASHNRCQKPCSTILLFLTINNHNVVFS